MTNRPVADAGGDLKGRQFVIVGAALMFIGVAVGAFGAHGLRQYFERFPELIETYDTAVRYHLLHALALFITAWVDRKWSAVWSRLAGYLFVLGIVFFSGALYLLILTRQSWLGAIAPIGGSAFLAGWASLLLAAWRAPPRGDNP